MGISYQCKIRCFKVKDLNKVDLAVLENVGENWRARLSEYYLTSKENIDRVLAVYSHEPSLKRGHLITKIAIPAETNVVAFGNDACDELDSDNLYDIYFFCEKRKLIEQVTVKASVERNNFMLIVPENAKSLDYGINDDGRNVHNFGLTNDCRLCKVPLLHVIG